jgi:hypothetical protein
MHNWLAVLLMSVPLLAQNTNCPAYPVSARNALAESNRQAMAFARYRLTAAKDGHRLAVTFPPIVNFIDKAVFARMQQDGVSPAPLTNDNELLRRIYLDLTGRIPTLEQAQAFLADSSSDRRARLVDSLLICGTLETVRIAEHTAA